MMGREITGDSRDKVMDHGMEGCMQMMRGMQGERQRPNKQWRQR